MTSSFAKLGACALVFIVSCSADVGDEPMPDPDTLQAELEQLAATDPAPVCAIDYARCLLRQPLDVLPCTEAAERCGLFDPALDAGVSPNAASPSCTLRSAECVVRNPLRARMCVAMCQSR